MEYFFLFRTELIYRAEPESRSQSVKATAVIKSEAANKSFQPILTDVHFSGVSGAANSSSFKRLRGMKIGGRNDALHLRLESTHLNEYS